MPGLKRTNTTGVAALSDPVSAKLYLWHKGLGRLIVWGDCVLIWGVDFRDRVCLCVCACLCDSGCKLIQPSPAAAGQCCSAALLPPRSLLSHRGGLLTQHFCSPTHSWKIPLPVHELSPLSLSLLSRDIHMLLTSKTGDVRRDEGGGDGRR